MVQLTMWNAYWNAVMFVVNFDSISCMNATWKGTCDMSIWWSRHVQPSHFTSKVNLHFHTCELFDTNTNSAPWWQKCWNLIGKNNCIFQPVKVNNNLEDKTENLHMSWWSCGCATCPVWCAIQAKIESSFEQICPLIRDECHPWHATVVDDTIPIYVAYSVITPRDTAKPEMW